MTESNLIVVLDKLSDMSLGDSSSTMSMEGAPPSDMVEERELEGDRERGEDEQWEQEGIARRVGELGFKPQKENPYNRLLPYADCLDEESNRQLSSIKANLARLVQLRDIKIGGTHWAGQLSKYIKLYGFKFSKQDHLWFIKLIFEMMTIPDLDFSMVVKFAQLLTSLLKKVELISREDLKLPWRPLYKLLKDGAASQYEDYGLILLPSNVENVLKATIRCCRVYFSVTATKEMLDEWRPLLCPFDVSMEEAVYYMECFLPTKVYPHEHDATFRLWFDELTQLWEACQNVTGWEPYLVKLFSRLAEDGIGYGIDWEPYIPKLFMSTLRSFNLPVGKVSVNVTPNGRNGGNGYEPRSYCIAIASTLGNGSSVQHHLVKLFKALESFYHPSNHDKWTIKLLKFLSKLCESVVKRVQRERYWKSWRPRPDVSSRLSQADITRFVECVRPTLYIAMFNKTGVSEITAAAHYLACLRPELILPGLLDRTYPALETLTEPHRLSSCLQCIVAVSRNMLDSPRWYPEGRQHVIPLLSLCLPGIDPNDIKKSVLTFHLFSSFSSLFPLVDCSDASQRVAGLTEEAIELCSATAQIEDLVLQLFDRMFTLIEACIHQHTRTDSSAATTANVSAVALSQEEALLEVCMHSVTYTLLRNSSSAIYNEALTRIFRFAMDSVFEINVAGRLISGVVQSAVRVRPSVATKRFIPEICRKILERCEGDEIKNDERVDNELLWNVKLLSEVVRCDGTCLLEYSDKLEQVIHATLHVKCKDITLLSGTLLRNILKQMSMIYPLNNNLTAESTLGKWLCGESWTEGLASADDSQKQRVPINDWGRWTNLRKVKVKWHVPNEEEIKMVTKLINTILVDEVKSITSHVNGSLVLSREELLQCLNVVHHCIQGAGALMPQWKEEPVTVIESEVKQIRFSQIACCCTTDIMINNENIRVYILNHMRPLVLHMLSTSEDDTKCLQYIIMILKSLMMFYGSIKEEFDSRWKNRSIAKQLMQNKVMGKKRHIEPVLLDRIQLQHEMRCGNQASKSITQHHVALLRDLFSLAISRYMQVRRSAQAALGTAFNMFPYSYRLLLDDILKHLNDDESAVERHALKGTLYLILGQNKHSLVTRRNWDVMKSLWPAMIKLRSCERPSMIKLYDEIIDRLHKDIEDTELVLTVHDEAVRVAELLWSSSDSKPEPDLPAASVEEIERCKQRESERNKYNVKCYEDLVSELVQLANSGNLRWKFYQVCVEMLTLLVRHDAKVSADVVQLFTKNLIHETINIRKISINIVTGILKVQKRAHKKIVVDPYKIAGVANPNQSSADPAHMTSVEPAHPGDRQDNEWMQYRKDKALKSEAEWKQTVFIDKTHWGYYMWPKQLKSYAASDEQPKLSRAREELDAAELPVFDCFTDSNFISELIKYLTLEENKGRERFHLKRFLLFKGLFRNFDDTVLTESLKQHVERLVSDTSHDTNESSQRCAAEIIAGVVRGCKHWTYDKIESLWSWLIPVLNKAFQCFTVESIRNWGTCMATCSENRDPRRLGPMFELLMDNPLNGSLGSFGDSSRLFLLQGLLAQQEWRVAEPLNRLYQYLLLHLSHPYKSVRDRIGSTLVNIFLYDVRLPLSRPASTLSPKRQSFLIDILPQLLSVQPAHSDAAADAAVSAAAAAVLTAAAAGSSDMKRDDNMMIDDDECDDDNGDDERKKKIRMCKTILKWIQGTYSRMFQCVSVEIYAVLPLACMLGSELKDPELTTDCLTAMTYLAVAPLSSIVLPTVITVIKQASEMTESWHAREAALRYCQISLFYNLFLVQSLEVSGEVRDVLIARLSDERVEVREMSSTTLAGLIQCGYIEPHQQLIQSFNKLCRTSIKKRNHASAAANGKSASVVSVAQSKSSDQSVSSTGSAGTVSAGSTGTISAGSAGTVLEAEDRLVRRHAGVLGLSACVLAHPYSVPDFLPDILMTLSNHLNDPQPIQMTVKRTMGSFKRTHMDSWVEEHKNKFSDDQLSVLTELLVSPNYYA